MRVNIARCNPDALPTSGDWLWVARGSTRVDEAIRECSR